SFLQPAVFSDVSGDYIGFDGEVRSDTARVHYANFSGWDVYRSWIQLMAVLAPRQASDLVHSLVESGTQCGALPQWSIANTAPNTMVGDPADATIAGAWAFGARDFDAAAALSLMKKGALDPEATCDVGEARRGLADYLARGYCPIDGAPSARGPA